jgi:polyhydroxyalkanoate synthesis regulator phasin
MTVGGDNDVQKAQQTAEEERARLSRTIGKLILASIGALTLAQETLEHLLDRMVERGEQVQEAARKRADELRDTRRNLLGAGKPNAKVELDAADVSTKADLRSLQAQVAALSAKVDLLSEAKSTAGDTGTALSVPEGSTPALNETPAPGI